MTTGVRETLCSNCLHCQVCAHKNDYLNMVTRLEELFYSVPEEERAAMAFRNPDCKFNQKKLSVPSFVNQRSGIKSPEELLPAQRDELKRYADNADLPNVIAHNLGLTENGTEVAR